jgi:hypothetical protein
MPVQELSSPPSLKALYPKALVGAIAAPVRRVPGLRALAGGDGRELPDLELVLGDVVLDRDHLTSYDRVCGFRLRDEVPATYPHVIAFPLSMQVMTDRAFPFPVIGLVHIRNRIEQLRALRLGERLTMRVRPEGLAPHDRGTQFDLVAEATVGGEPVWRSQSTYLHREGSGSDGGGRRDERPAPPEPSAVWSVPGDIGRRYAGVSGDRNPIHLRRVTSLPFGFPRPIAHGMWLKARCLAAHEGLLPAAYAVDVSFKLPVVLPARVAFASWSDGDGRGFSLHDEGTGKPHLRGTVEPA